MFNILKRVAPLVAIGLFLLPFGAQAKNAAPLLIQKAHITIQADKTEGTMKVCNTEQQGFKYLPGVQRPNGSYSFYQNILYSPAKSCTEVNLASIHNFSAKAKEALNLVLLVNVNKNSDYKRITAPYRVIVSDVIKSVAETAIPEPSETIEEKPTRKNRVTYTKPRYSPGVVFDYVYLKKGERQVNKDNILYSSKTMIPGDNEASFMGYDFDTQRAVRKNGGTFYVTHNNSRNESILFTPDARAGIVDLGKGALNTIRFAPSTGYKQLAPAKEGHNYVVYDSTHQHYAIIHINQLIRQEVPVAFTDAGEKTASTNPENKLTGVVSDERGMPLNNARITLMSADKLKTLATTTSDRYGSYTLNGTGMEADIAYLLEFSNPNMAGEILKIESETSEYNAFLYYDRKVDFSYKYNTKKISYFTYHMKRSLWLSVGKATLSTSEGGGENAGFNFLHRGPVTSKTGAFYVAMDNGVLKLFGNRQGQGGLVDMGPGALPEAGDIPATGYERDGIVLYKGHNYAVYDQFHNAYVVIHIENVNMAK
jgi:hypothetical protein